MPNMPSRRRFIAITACAAGAALMPPWARAREMHTVTWEGQALGAGARMALHHPDRQIAEQLVRQSVAEVARLERVFSLYRQDSALA